MDERGVMHIPTHILSGWCLANLFPTLGPRERLFCMIAAAVQDLDGLGIIGDFLLRHDEPTWYWALHHKLGHGIVACILVTAILTFFSKSPRWIACLAYVSAFHLHLVMDYFGSGPNWDIYYFWPVSERGWIADNAWPLFSWQNIVAAALLLTWTIWIVRVKKRTPLEALVSSLDRRWVRAVESFPVAGVLRRGDADVRPTRNVQQNP